VFPLTRHSQKFLLSSATSTTPGIFLQRIFQKLLGSRLVPRWSPSPPLPRSIPAGDILSRSAYPDHHKDAPVGSYLRSYMARSHDIDLPGDCRCTSRGKLPAHNLRVTACHSKPGPAYPHERKMEGPDHPPPGGHMRRFAMGPGVICRAVVVPAPVRT
jgi:hypothetical protein